MQILRSIDSICHDVRQDHEVRILNGIWISTLSAAVDMVKQGHAVHGTQPVAEYSISR